MTVPLVWGPWCIVLTYLKDTAMIITDIRQTSPGRLTVGFDDGSEVKTTLGVVTDLRLFSGKELESEAYEGFVLASRRSLARERALEILARRPMSRHELKVKLMDKGEDEDIAEFCAGWLADNGLIDDESYAMALGRHYAAKGFGPGRLRAELSKRGIDRELWDAALDGMPVNEGKMDRFIAAHLKDPGDREQVRKVSAALFRKGHSWDEIRAALARFEAEAEFED